MASWIFLRGLARESGHWGDFVDTFQATFPTDTLILLDLPGNGGLHRLRSPRSVAAMVSTYRAQLVRRGVAPPYHLLALSLGGMVAVAWAQTHPHEIASQVLINTSMRPFSPFYQRLRPSNVWPMLRVALPSCSDQVREGLILRMTSARADPAAAAEWLGLRRLHPVSNRNVLAQLLAAARFCADLQAPALPTLVLASAQDRLVSAQCSQAIARAWRCDLRVHPWAGHDLPLDDGAWVAQQVLAWRVTKMP